MTDVFVVNGGMEDQRPAVLTNAPGKVQPVISPELVLVCPELRAFALQRLPDRDPDGFLPKRAADEAWQQPIRGLRAEPEESKAGGARDERGAGAPPEAEEEVVGGRLSVGVAVGAYAVQQCIYMALYGVVAIAALSSLILLVSYLHPR